MAATRANVIFSENVRKLQPSATIAVSTLAKELRAAGRDIINLSAGEPDFPTPGFISRAGMAAIERGATRYTPAAGTPELRAAAARFLARERNPELDPAGVVVTAGAKQALFNALFTLAGPGDRVLVPTPYWTSYPELVRLARAEPIFLAGPESRGYKVGPVELEEAWDPSVRALLMNSPSNPSGAVYSLAEMEAVARWAADHDVWIISDEIYGRLWYEGDVAPGMLDLDPALAEQTVVVNGASKTFAMTGWRIGFSYSVPALASKMAALQSHMTSNAATPSQHAVVAALNPSAEESAELDAMVAAFHTRRDLVVSLMAELMPDATFVRPEGAFYLFFRVDAYYDEEHSGSVALCQHLIQEAGVALVPGEAFGNDRYVRLSFAASDQDLENGLRRVAELLA
jgi:aspartate aminotransferase